MPLRGIKVNRASVSGQGQTRMLRSRWAVTLLALSLVLSGCVQPGDGTAEGLGTNSSVTSTEAPANPAPSSGAGETAAPGNVSGGTTSAPQMAMVHSVGTQVVGPDDVPLNLRCVNLDGWLWPTVYLISDSGNALFVSTAEFVDRMDEVVDEARADKFWKDWRDSFVTAADFERMSTLGFNCVRLVIYYRSIASIESGEPVFDEEALAYLDSAVAWGEQHGVYVVLDLHSAPGGQNAFSTVSDVPATDPVPRLWEGPEAQANQDATVAIWRTLAERYADEPWVAGYDLLNEPDLPPGRDGSDLVNLCQSIITAIRSVDQGHMIILEGDALAADFSVFDAPLDGNMMYEFHAYALTGFEEWATPELGDLQPYLTLREEHDRPIWLGEFGEGSQDWITMMVDLMDSHDIGWALFPWKRKQTLFWNPVMQRIDDMPKWYVLAAYLAQPAGGSIPPPSIADAEAAMAEVLSKIPLSSNTEDGSLAKAIFGS